MAPRKRGGLFTENQVADLQKQLELSNDRETALNKPKSQNWCLRLVGVR
ncbi:MAG: hypothetical protein OXL96_07775 [Candidatus Poribacteria bacterium]|nr:hypothetical protein [Candidatus Poribacteria bacterium]